MSQESSSPFGLAALIRSGRVSAVDVMRRCRERVEAQNDVLAAFVHLDWEAAFAAARAVDAAIAEGTEVGPLAGVPFGVKDMESCAGMPTRFGSALFRDAIPATKDDPHVARLRAAGAIPVGKTATPEFASGLITVTRDTVTRNPWNPEITPGGSSGGSAAAVASGMVTFATGSDAGGSLRIPASFCGLVGMKTTLDLVPVVPREASHTNCLGVLTADVADTARLLDVIAGPLDGSRPYPGDLAARASSRSLDGVRIAYEPGLAGAGATPEVAAACDSAVERLLSHTGMKASAERRQLPEDISDTFLKVCGADAWSMLDVDGALAQEELLTDYARARFHRAETMTVADLGRGDAARRRIRDRFADWFTRAEVFCFPTMSTCEVPAPGPAPTRVPGQVYEGPSAACPLTRIANLIGAPAVSVPVGIAANGVPIGLQIMTPPGSDDLALAVALRLQTLLRPLALPHPVETGKRENQE